MPHFPIVTLVYQRLSYLKSDGQRFPPKKRWTRDCCWVSPPIFWIFFMCCDLKFLGLKSMFFLFWRSSHFFTGWFSYFDTIHSTPCHRFMLGDFRNSMQFHVWFAECICLLAKRGVFVPVVWSTSGLNECRGRVIWGKDLGENDPVPESWQNSSRFDLFWGTMWGPVYDSVQLVLT